MTVEDIRAMVAERAPELVDRLAAAEDAGGAITGLLNAWTEARDSRAVQDEKTKAERAGALAERAGTVARMAELEQLAADGKAYREDLIGQAVASRVRAQGSGFDADAYRAVLAGQPLTYVRGESAAWEKMVGEALQAGRPVGDVIGRKTPEGDRKTQSEPGRPSGSYKA